MAKLAERLRPEAVRHGARRPAHVAPDPAADRQRERGHGRVRRHYLQQGAGADPHAGELPRRSGVPRRHPRLHGRACLWQHHHRRSLAGAGARGPQAGDRNRGVLYRTGRRAADIGRNRLQRRCAAADAAAGPFRDRAGADGVPCRRATGKYRLRSGRCGAAQPADVVLLQGSTEIPAGSCGEAIKVNLGDIGYYRVEYGPASMAALAKALPQMSPADRVNFLADSWAMVQAGRAEPSSYLALVENVGVDDRRPVWDQVITVFSALNRLSRDRARAPGAAALCPRQIAPGVRPARLGWQRLGRRRRHLAAQQPDLDARRTRRRGRSLRRRSGGSPDSSAIRNRCRGPCAIPSPMSSASRRIVRPMTRC